MTWPTPPQLDPDLTVRTETPEDRTWLLELYATMRQDELDAAGFPEPLRRSFLEQQFNARDASYRSAFSDASWWILSASGRPVGRSIVHRSDQEIRVVDLAFLPSHRRRGLGTRLLQWLQAEATAAQVPLRLQTFPESPAVRLYLRLGFEITGNEGLRVQLEWSPPRKAS